MRYLFFYVSQIMCCAAFLTACATRMQPAPVASLNKGAQGTHLVSAGETLSEIAARYGWGLQELADANDKAPPYQLQAGEKIQLTAKSTPKKQARLAQVAQQERIHRSTPKFNQSAKPKPLAVSKQWMWPAHGRLTRAFKSDADVDGVDIKNNLGSPVFAAAQGTVVYSGTGLRGYGKLIIIKHPGGYLSAYAHNSVLVAREGERVKAGEKIAEMGNTGATSTKLHFQIRFQGKPINPLRILPGKPQLG